MTDKYYTPTIEEFHVGFEYEYQLPPGDWTKSTFSLNEIDIEFAKNRNTRCKYLDSDDITSLEWITIEKEGMVYAVNKNLTHYIDLDPQTRQVKIHHLEDGTLFFGTIKNKSLLRLILSMIGI